MNRAGQTEEDDDFFSAEGETAPEEKRSEGDFDELDALWDEAGEKKGEGALADEFDIVYSARNSARNVEEIGKQPLIAPEAPQKTKKRKFF